MTTAAAWRCAAGARECTGITCLRCIRIVRDHIHAQAARAAGHLTANLRMVPPGNLSAACITCMPSTQGTTAALARPPCQSPSPPTSCPPCSRPHTWCGPSAPPSWTRPPVAAKDRWTRRCVGGWGGGGGGRGATATHSPAPQPATRAGRSSTPARRCGPARTAARCRAQQPRRCWRWAHSQPSTRTRWRLQLGGAQGGMRRGSMRTWACAGRSLAPTPSPARSTLSMPTPARPTTLSLPCAAGARVGPWARRWARGTTAPACGPLARRAPWPPRTPRASPWWPSG